MHSLSSCRSRAGYRFKVLLLGVLAVSLGTLALSGPAKADPFAMTLDNGRINLGFAFKGASILPAPDRIPADNPTPNLPDLWQARDTTSLAPNPASAPIFGCLTPVMFNATNNPPTPTADPNPAYPCGPNPPNATVSGDLTAGAITIAAAPNGGPANQWGLPNGFRFPIMVVPNPLDNSPVPITLAATGPVTGTAGTDGQGRTTITMSGPIEARVLTGLTSNPLGEYCAVPLEGLELSTTSNSDFAGVPFEGGITGTGALTGTFNITQDAVSVGGADCATVNQVSKGAGSIWLSSGIPEPPVCPEGTTGVPPDCIPTTCPPGTEGTPPNCNPIVAPKANIRVLRWLGPTNVRRFRGYTYRVVIRNSGNRTANGVRIQIRGKRLFANFPVGRIGPNKTRTVRVRVKFRQLGRVVARLKVVSNNAGTRNARKVVRVRR